MIPVNQPLYLEQTSYFPSEIYDLLIGHLHCFTSSLSSCSMVCKAWLPACRYHLFWNVNLSPELVAFLHSSVHAMETIGPYIRNVTLGRAWPSVQIDDLDSALKLLLRLDGVHKLALEGWALNSMSPSITEILLNTSGKPFHTTTKIHLRHFRFPSFPLLAAFVSGFSVLKDLSLDNVTWDPLPIPPILPSPPPLKDFYILSTSLEPVLNWLFQVGDHEIDTVGASLTVKTPLLQLFSVQDILPNELALVGSIIRTLGTSLRHLEIGFSSHDSNIYIDNYLDFSYNTNLHILRLHHLTLYQFPPSSSAIPVLSPGNASEHGMLTMNWLIPLLNSISSSLRELSFFVWLSAEKQLDLINWIALVRVLSQPAFESLEKLQFRTLMGEGRNDLKDWLLRRLREWPAAGDVIEVLPAD